MPKRKAATSSSSDSPAKIAKTDGCSSSSNDDFCTQLRQLIHEGADNTQLEQLVATFYPPQPQVQGVAPEFKSLALMPNKEVSHHTKNQPCFSHVSMFYHSSPFSSLCSSKRFLCLITKANGWSSSGILWISHSFVLPKSLHLVIDSTNLVPSMHKSLPHHVIAISVIWHG